MALTRDSIDLVLLVVCDIYLCIHTSKYATICHMLRTMGVVNFMHKCTLILRVAYAILRLVHVQLVNISTVYSNSYGTHLQARQITVEVSRWSPLEKLKIGPSPLFAGWVLSNGE